MDYIIYTIDGTTLTEKGDRIENCQILDFQCSTTLSASQCIQNYIQNHPLEESGFLKEHIFARPCLGYDTLGLIKDLLHYLECSSDMQGNIVLMEKVKILNEYFK